MITHAQVSLDAVQNELPAVVAYAEAAGLRIETAALGEDHLSFRVRFRNLVLDEFVAEIDCRDYPLYPPTVEFVDPVGSANRGTHSLYPAGFHPMPCVCARYNRKAYGERGGPHGNWRMVDWQLPTEGGVAMNTLALIVSDLHSKIARSPGRMV